MNSYLFSFPLPDCFDLAATLTCGQCFRWKQQSDGSFFGVVEEYSLILRQEGRTLWVSGSTPESCGSFLSRYFDFDRDYSKIDHILCRDSRLKAASACGRGIRILRQDPFEALCSFIFSQNNNIPRISGMIDRLCCCFGRELSAGTYSFPSAETLAGLCESDLAPVRAGFRTRYLLDAAARVADGRLRLGELPLLPLAEARRRLMTVCGVGPKVADCVLLFGCGRLDAFPRDVWINRVMDEEFPDGLPDFASPLAGIAQQYLFVYRRAPAALHRV